MKNLIENICPADTELFNAELSAAAGILDRPRSGEPRKLMAFRKIVAKPRRHFPIQIRLLGRLYRLGRQILTYSGHHSEFPRLSFESPWRESVSRRLVFYRRKLLLFDSTLRITNSSIV